MADVNLVAMAILLLVTWSSHGARGQVCPGQVDVAVAMDDSPSLLMPDFLSIKDYTKSLVGTFQVGAANAIFSVITFADRVQRVVTKSTDSAAITAAIDAYSRMGISGSFGGTNIALAMDTLTAVLTENSRTDVPKVMVIVTDGIATTPVTSAAQRAADKGVVVIAVMVGRKYAMQQLLNITNHREENIITAETFINLTTDALEATSEKICKISILGFVTQYCDKADGYLGIGVHVLKSTQSNVASNYIALFLNNMKDNLLKVTVSMGANTTVRLTDKTLAQSLLLQNAAQSSASQTGDTTAAIVRNLMNNMETEKIRNRRSILLILDGLRGSLTELKAEVDKARRENVEVVVLGLDMYRDVTSLNTVMGSRTNRILIPHSLKAVVTSGFNQAMYRLCYVIRDSQPPPLDLFKYYGPADLHLTLDTCDDTPYLRHPSTEPFVKFLSAILDNVYLHPDNVSVSASLVTCSGKHTVIDSRNHNYALSQHVSIATPGVYYYGVTSDSSASAILREMGDKFAGNPGHAILILITDTKPDPDLRMVAYYLRSRGLLLMPVGVYPDSADDNYKQEMMKKTAMVNKDFKLMVSASSLSFSFVAILNQMYKGVADNRSLQLSVGMSSAATFRSNLDNKNQVQTLMSNIATYIRSFVFRMNSYDEATHRALMKQQLSRSSLAPLNNLHAAVTHIRELSAQYDFGLIITNQVYKYNLTDTGGIVIGLTGWNDDAGTGPLTMEDISTEMRNRLSASGGFTDTLVMIDSSDYISLTEFENAKTFAYNLLVNLSLQLPLGASIHTFAEGYVYDIPKMSFTNRTAIRTALNGLTHLMLRSPVHKMIQSMTKMAEESAIKNAPGSNVKTIAFIMMNSQIRYRQETEVAAVNAESAPWFMSFVVLDATKEGNLDVNVLTTNANHIFRLQGRTNWVQEALTRISTLLREPSYLFQNGQPVTGYQVLLGVDLMFGMPAELEKLQTLLVESLARMGNVPTELGLVLMDGFTMDSHLFLETNHVYEKLFEYNQRRSESTVRGLSTSTYGMLQDNPTAKPYGPRVHGVTMVTDKVPSNPTKLSEVSRSATTDFGVNVMAMGYGNPSLTTDSIRSFTNSQMNKLYVTNDEDTLLNGGLRWYIKTVSDLSPSVRTTTTSTTSTTTVTTTTADQSEPSTTPVAPPTLQCYQDMAIFLAATTSKRLSNYVTKLMLNDTERVLESKNLTIRQTILLTAESSNTVSSLELLIKSVESTYKLHGIAPTTEVVAVLLVDDESTTPVLNDDIFIQLRDSRVSYVVRPLTEIGSDAMEDLERLTRGNPKMVLYDSDVTPIEDRLYEAVCLASIPSERTNVTMLCDRYAPKNPVNSAQSSFLPYPFDCQYFLHCYWSGALVRASVVRCPADSMWHKTSSKCEHGTVDDCAIDGFKNGVPDDLVTSGLVFVDIQNQITERELNARCEDICDSEHAQNAGYGYGEYEHDCSKFVFCVRNGGVFRGKLLSCAKGLFWDQNSLACKRPELVLCKNDPCKSIPAPKPRPLTCNMQFTCERGRTVLMLCKDNEFLQNSICYLDNNNKCDVNIVPVEECRLMQGSSLGTYMDTNDPFHTRKCPCGRYLDMNACACTGIDPNAPLCDACQPSFEDDMSGHGSLNNVLRYGGVAVLDGRGLYTIQDHGQLDTFVFNMKVKVQSGNDVEVMSTCSGTSPSSLVLSTAGNRLILVMTGVGAISVNFQLDEWQTITIAYRDNKIVLKAGDRVTSFTVNTGTKMCLNNWNIGLGAQTSGGEGMYGQIDHITVYKCIPADYQPLFNN